jgi:peroxiredoxin Q/BCP
LSTFRQNSSEGGKIAPNFAGDSIMKRQFAFAASLLVLCATANAALKPGDTAPLFTTQAAVGGKEMPLVLADALKKGPVVLYFFPKSFTSGCTLEAHLFAEATEKFTALGATVVGVSHDDIATQLKFSKEECRDKFAVAADPDSAIIKSYDAKLAMLPMSGRISYVISPDDKIIYTYNDLDAAEHVNKTMKAVQDWRAKH